MSSRINFYCDGNEPQHCLIKECNYIHFMLRQRFFTRRHKSPRFNPRIFSLLLSIKSRDIPDRSNRNSLIKVWIASRVLYTESLVLAKSSEIERCIFILLLSLFLVSSSLSFFQKLLKHDRLIKSDCFVSRL